jgi:hypothetical protein
LIERLHKNVGARLKCHPTRKIEMTPRVGGGHDESELNCIPAVKVEQRILLWRWIGIGLLLSMTGEAEAGSAGEQPAEE